MVGSAIDLERKFDEGEVDRSPFKIAVYSIIYVASALFLSYGFAGLVIEPNYYDAILFFAGLVLFMVLFSLLPLFIKRALYLTGVILSGTLGLAVFFYDWFSAGVAVIVPALALAFLFFLWGAFLERHEYENMVRVRFYRLLRTFLPKAINGLAVFAAAVIYLNLTPSGGGDFVLSEYNFSALLNYFAAPAKHYLPKTFQPILTFDKPIDETLKTFAAEQLKSDPNFAKATAAAQNTAISQSVDALISQLSGYLNIKIDRRLNGAKVLYQALRENFGRLQPPIQRLSYLGFFLSLFLLLKAASYPLIWVVNLFAFMVYEFLLAIMFANSVYESRSKEIIIL